MADSPTTHIEALARRSARAGLKLRDARALFNALYVADALMLSGGNMHKAAVRAGYEPAALFRMRERPMTTGENDDA